MKLEHTLLLAVSSIIPKSVSSFALRNLSPSNERDVYTMSDWAQSCGVQQAEGIQLTSYDGMDYFPATQSDIPAGSPVMFVPSDLIFSSSKAAQEFGGELSQCENQLVAAGLQDKVPLFRIFFKVMAEYDKGEQSAWFPWLNSLPRTFNTGASMTYDCFDVLPPYAAYCAFAERQNLVNFQKAATTFSPNHDSETLKWAYNVAITRSIERNNERFIAPLVDMFNHGADATVEISYDGNTGDCNAYASADIPAGSPLQISYVADPMDSTPLFATYGFLDETASATFCKLMHMLPEMEELGYSFADLLFYKETGDISPQVYDVVLYHVLKKSDQSLAQQFYQAVMSGDEATKGQFQEQYWQYTKEELQSHVDGLLVELDQWSYTASQYDLNTHPRVPLILQHNAFVKDTFLRVKSTLDNM